MKIRKQDIFKSRINHFLLASFPHSVVKSCFEPSCFVLFFFPLVFLTCPHVEGPSSPKLKVPPPPFLLRYLTAVVVFGWPGLVPAPRPLSASAPPPDTI